MSERSLGLVQICKEHDVVLIDASSCRYDHVSIPYRIVTGETKRPRNEQERYMRRLLELATSFPNLYTHPLVLAEMKEGREGIKNGSSRVGRYRETLNGLIELMEERCFGFNDVEYWSLHDKLREFMENNGLTAANSALLLTAIRAATIRGPTALLSNNRRILKSLVGFKRGRRNGEIDVAYPPHRLDGYTFKGGSFEFYRLGD